MRGRILISVSYYASDIPDGQCAWIGASTWNYPDYELRWLQLPISYRSPRTDGENLKTFNNFESGNELITEIFLIYYIWQLRELSVQFSEGLSDDLVDSC